jgi:hypothetical protein
MLLTAGCSFVWGDELKGFDDNPPTHWPFTFTHLLAGKMAMPYINLGSCGAGNDKIFREVTDYLHNPRHETPVTHIVVMWSAFQRAEVVEYMPKEREIKIQRHDDVTQFSPLRTSGIYNRNKRRVMNDWFDNAYDSRTDVMHTLTKMKTLELLCDSMGIKLVQGFFHKRCWSNIMSILRDNGPDEDDTLVAGSMPLYTSWLKNSIIDLKPTSRVGAGKGKDLYTIAIENDDLRPHGHPGEKTQVIFSDFLYKKFIDM